VGVDIIADKLRTFLKFNSKLIFVAKKYSIRESITHFFDKNQLLKPACFDFAVAYTTKFIKEARH
jgi:hypothetical protein